MKVSLMQHSDFFLLSVTFFLHFYPKHNLLLSPLKGSFRDPKNKKKDIL